MMIWLIGNGVTAAIAALSFATLSGVICASMTITPVLPTMKPVFDRPPSTQ